MGIYVFLHAYLNMAHNNKRIINNSLHMYFRMILVTGITLYTSRIVFAQLGVTDFGLYNAVGGVVLFFSFIVPTLSSSVQRFLSYEIGKGDIEMAGKVFSMSIQIHLLIAAIIMLLGESIGLWFLNTQMNIPDDRMAAANVVYQCSILSLVMILWSVPFNGLIIAKQKMKIYAWFSVITAMLKLLTAYLLIVSPIDRLSLYAVLMLLIFVIGRINVSVYCSWKIKDVRYHRIWDKSLFRRLLSFSGWTLYGNVGNMAYSYGLNIVLNICCGPAVNAARAISTQIQNVTDQFSGSFQTAVNPQLTQSYAAKDYDYVNKLFLSATNFSFYLMALICIPAYIEMDEVIRLWLGDYPDYSVSFARLTLIICCINAVFNPTFTLVQATGNIRKFQIIQGTAMILIIPFSFYFLHQGYDADVVFYISIIIILLTRIACTRVMLRLLPFLSIFSLLVVLIKGVFLVLISGGVSFVFSNTYCKGFMGIVYLVLFNTIVYSVLAYFSLSRYERDMAKKLICKIKKNSLK